MTSVAVSIRLLPEDQKHWTNGERLTGVVQLSSKQPVDIKLVQLTLVCEEWVHTGSLEFKEHFRNSNRVWPHTSHAVMKIEADETVTLPFDIPIPPQRLPKKYPPSFSLRYNSISWRIKSVVVSSPPGSLDIYTSEAEKPFQLCTRDPQPEEDEPSGVEPLALDEYSYTVTNKDFLPVRLEKQEDGTTHLISLGKNEFHNMPTGSLQVCLMIPQSGLLQNRGQSTPIFMEVTLSGVESMEVAELDLSIIETADTYYKDPLISVRKLKTLKNIIFSEGVNKIDTTIDADKLEGLTEDFKTEWQNITHIFKLLFLCRSPGDRPYGALKWEVPVRLLSAAEKVRYL